MFVMISFLNVPQNKNLPGHEIKGFKKKYNAAF
jgi:hypothetical protein